MCSAGVCAATAGSSETPSTRDVACKGQHPLPPGPSRRLRNLMGDRPALSGCVLSATGEGLGAWVPGYGLPLLEMGCCPAFLLRATLAFHPEGRSSRAPGSAFGVHRGHVSGHSQLWLGAEQGEAPLGQQSAHGPHDPESVLKGDRACSGGTSFWTRLQQENPAPPHISLRRSHLGRRGEEGSQSGGSRVNSSCIWQPVHNRGVSTEGPLWQGPGSLDPTLSNSGLHGGTVVEGMGKAGWLEAIEPMVLGREG